MTTEVKTNQEKAYVDLVNMIIDIGRRDFGIDLLHGPLFAGQFKKYLDRYDDEIGGFIRKWIHNEELPPVQPIPQVSLPQPVGRQEVLQEDLEAKLSKMLDEKLNALLAAKTPQPLTMDNNVTAPATATVDTKQRGLVVIP